MKSYLRGFRSGLLMLAVAWLLPAFSPEPLVQAQPRLSMGSLLPYSAHSSPRMTQEWHGLSGWAGYDFATACGEKLYSPVDGMIAYNGLDGYNHVDASGRAWPQSSMLVIEFGDGYEYVLLHGDYIAEVGTAVSRGDLIGYEASNGWSTGCHSHIAIRKNGAPVEWGN